MRQPRAWRTAIGLCALALGAAAAAQTRPDPQPADALEQAFRVPPPSAKPWTFWYWLKASSSRAGIQADLEAMQAAGLAGAHLVPIQGATNPPLFDPPAEQFSALWWDHVLFALTEADRLGLKIAMHASDGYATAGGPWITPELSMQKLVWTATPVQGGRAVEFTLPQPETVAGYYRDVVTLAYPVAGEASDSRSCVPVVTTSLPAIDAQFLARDGQQVFASETGCWIQYAFAEPFTCRSITIRLPRTKGIQFTTYHANHLAVEVSQDGEHFTRVAQLEPPRHGWQDGDADVTHAIPAVTARFFRFVHDPSHAEAGAEDLDAAKWKTVLKLCGIDLSSAARLHQFEGKSGLTWRISPPTTEAQLPGDHCVPRESMVDLSAHVAPDGRLAWDAPPGSWIVLRLGHTSTGARNDPAGAMIGLECDKFNPAAARLLFDRWFGEILRRAGPELAARVLKVLHVDSWECGSQNWSAGFRAEFQRRRGYDPLPFLPAVAGVAVDSVAVSERFLRDLRETAAELVTDNFYRPLAELAHAHGCTFSSETVAPVMVSDDLTPMGVVDTPMGEFWLRSPTHDKVNDMLDAISGAHVYGKPVIQAEAFTEVNLVWDETPALVKSLGDFNYALGANRFVYHVFVHNPWTDRQPGMALGHVGLFFQRDQTWFRPGRAWVTYAARCQALLQQGQPVVDLAVFTGEEVPRRALVPWQLAPSLPGFFPANDPRLKKEIVETLDWVDPLDGYAYDSLSRDALLRLARVTDGRITLPGGASYAALLLPAAHPGLPDATALSPEVATRLRRLAEAGATILISERPTHPAGLAGGSAGEAALAEHVAALWPADAPARGTAAGLVAGRVVRGVFQGASFAPLGLAPDFSATTARGDRATGVAWNHRRGADWDLYFVSNQLDTPRELRLSLRTIGRRPELWDPVTGLMCEASRWEMRGGRTELDVMLPPAGSVFVVLRRALAAGSTRGGDCGSVFSVAQEMTPRWQVSFAPAFGGPEEPQVFPALASWSDQPDPRVRYYSGTARYAATFAWNAGEPPTGRVWLDLGAVADLAEVTVNGVSCGVAWTPPYRVDITSALRAGSNELAIDVTNTWFNRLVGDQALPPEQRRTWTNAPALPADAPLRPAGLLGPVRLLRETLSASNPR